MYPPPRPHPPRRPAFTLIELMVVIAIVVILLAVSSPLLKSLAKNNGIPAAVNLLRGALSNARAVAIAQHRQAGIVLFEETTANAGTEAHMNQTAVQTVIEQATQTSPINTVFTNYDTNRQYLPSGIGVAALNHDPTIANFATGENSSATAKVRVILFDSNGQLVLRDGVARPNSTGSAGMYTKMCMDWNFITVGETQTSSASSPGVLIYDRTELLNQAPANIDAWLKANAQLLIINSYTGDIIRDWGGVNK